MKYIDIIVPCYNESEVIEIFYEKTKEIIAKLSQYKFAFIFIDDGSSDDSLKIMKKLADNDSFIKYISFSRNFGKEAGMYAGLKTSKADAAIIMDVDMQNPPEIIIEFVQAIEEGYDAAAACRNRAGEGFVRNFFSKRFYLLINKISEIDMKDGAGDFRILTRKVINAVLAMSEVQRFSKGIFSWVGFDTKLIYFENQKRVAGTSKWSFSNLFKYAFDGITSFSVFPLRLVIILGSLVSLSSFIYLIYIIYKTIKYGIDVPGYASTIILLLFIGGIIILSIGVLGEYLSKVYMEVKNRPIYLVKDSNIED